MPFSLLKLAFSHALCACLEIGWRLMVCGLIYDITYDNDMGCGSIWAIAYGGIRGLG